MPVAPPAPDLAAWLRLSLTNGLNGEAFRKLLVTFGGPEQILGASRTALTAVVSGKLADAILDGDLYGDLAAVEAWLADSNNHVVTLADGEYPQALLQTPDPPPLIYVKGRLDLLNAPSLAVVGSRNATAQGKLTAESFSTALSNAGLAIVSGMALGIDAAAHQGGLAGLSSTVAIVGTGLDKVYPARNRDLAHAIAGRGAIVSEFALGTPPVAANFPRRNRVIAGLARGVPDGRTGGGFDLTTDAWVAVDAAGVVVAYGQVTRDEDDDAMTIGYLGRLDTDHRQMAASPLAER